MSKIHLLNVGEGDCTIIEHDSGHVTVIDICNGNQKGLMSFRDFAESSNPNGNFNMNTASKRTNPIEYLKKLGHKDIFRFILL